MIFILAKNNLTDTLRQWSADFEVFAPQKVGNYTQFLPFNPSRDVIFDEPHNTRYPPKALFLPQSEALLVYNAKLHRLEDARARQKPRIIFGIRPCDASAVHLLDSVFIQQDLIDPFWQTRRDSTVLIGMSCEHPGETCFCTTVGSGPFNTNGLDALLTDLGSFYFVETCLLIPL